MQNIFLFVALFLLCSVTAYAQVRLENPSFEGERQDATVPLGWHPCAEGTTPDILPGFWGVYTEPSDGESYLGLITREDGSFESLGQQLDPFLDEKTCYIFKMDLAYSRSYSGYNMPLKLRVWGSRKACKREQLLFETDFIENAEWETYEFMFTTKKHVKYIVIEAQPAPGVFLAYKGNILLDNLSVFSLCDRAGREIRLLDFRF